MPFGQAGRRRVRRDEHNKRGLGQNKVKTDAEGGGTALGGRCLRVRAGDASELGIPSDHKHQSASTGDVNQVECTTRRVWGG